MEGKPEERTGDVVAAEEEDLRGGRRKGKNNQGAAEGNGSTLSAG